MDSNQFTEPMASLMVKLTRAKWIKASATTKARLAVEWENLGLEKAAKLNGLLYEVGPLSPEEHLCLNFAISASEDLGLI